MHRKISTFLQRIFYREKIKIFQKFRLFLGKNHNFYGKSRNSREILNYLDKKVENSREIFLDFSFLDKRPIFWEEKHSLFVQIIYNRNRTDILGKCQAPGTKKKHNNPHCFNL